MLRTPAVFIGGIIYIEWYKWNVLNKIESAFSAGYDPALVLSLNAKQKASEDWRYHLRRKEQDHIDRIMRGEEAGKYYAIIGPKGTGKGTMILDAMHAVNAEGVAFCEAHPDLEVFRLRLGKALNYEYNEDSQTGLFQRRDPREGGAALDIERALNKVEKVALSLSRRKGRALVLVFNNIHLLTSDEAGRNILTQLQQRAEAWAASGILTVVFSTDDFWPFFALRRNANRMQSLYIGDLSPSEAYTALRKIQHDSLPPTSTHSTPESNPHILHQALNIIGGRLSLIGKVARSTNPLSAANHLLNNEKQWLRSQIGLIPDCDDDVMDEQKWSSCSWLLLQAFVEERRKQEQERDAAKAAGQQRGEADVEEELPLPAIPYWRCRQIMTRPDFLEELDRKNIISVDVHHDVRPDSLLTLQAARQVVEEDDFESTLQNVRDRIDEIESLHRTRELTVRLFLFSSCLGLC
ncbi:hypothetical protein SISNIDRAFT_419955 [Sistotremastrum niveocremeum HHB9708]|uniref:Uncharacterized protein n=1 Tax=Sistotremastrum niveocremeum HHB9708 TaxID=1314777 RepID=A0A164MZF3_9AGAM|nr:hypothetical protein SISNIDRAFT_419955 [Sistotremastrum niveocremeum HHB9708]